MKNIFWLPLVVFVLMTACTDKELEENIKPCLGEEVSFSINANGNASRTLYGDANESGVVVNWVKGDKVNIYGTTCSNQSAVYMVPDAANGTNAAGTLVKTGAAGLQWGNETNSDFYSVYPSTSKITPVVESEVVTSVNVATEIRKQQNVTFKKDDANGVWIGQHYTDDSNNPTMTDAVMYAVKKGAVAGQPVNLEYKPFTTVLRFNFAGYELTGAMGGEAASTLIYVNRIVISSPFAISGNFTMNVGYDDVNDIPVARVNSNLTANANNSQIIIYPDYLPLANGEKLQFDVFAIPQDYVLTKEKYFVVTIETNSGNFTYHMIPTVVNEEDGKVNTMKAGYIHKVNIPAKKITSSFKIPASEWLKYVPRNVYLSELSMPGAWYCMDEAYQGAGVTLQSLYEKGVRAFNIDCRVTKNHGSIANITSKWADSDYPDNCYLCCAGTEDPGGFSGYQFLKDGVKVADAVDQLITLAKANPNELISIIFTFAEKPCTNSGTSFGSVNPAYISQKLSEILEARKSNLYSGITNMTTVGDVIRSGKNIIVKINHSNKEFYNGSFTMPTGFMASYAPMVLAGADNDGNYWNNETYSNISVLDADQYSTMKSSKIYNGKDLNNITYYYCQAQKTYSDGNGTPTIEDRKKAINAVLGKAKEIYDTSTHDALFQLGIGGSLKDDQTAIASNLNAYVQEKIEAMLSTTASESTLSPLGFVLMNYCLDKTYGIPLINDILEINTKFYLNRNKDDDEWPEDCGGNPYETGEGTEMGS